MRTHVNLGSLLCNFGFSGEGYAPENQAELPKTDAREEADRRLKMESFKSTTDVRHKWATNRNRASFNQQWKKSRGFGSFWKEKKKIGCSSANDVLQTKFWHCDQIISLMSNDWIITLTLLLN